MKMIEKQFKEKFRIRLKKKNNDNDIEKKIHCIWYCVDCQANHFDESELNYIKQFNNIPVIIVLTQSCFEDDKNEMINFIREKKLKYIYPTGVGPPITQNIREITTQYSPITIHDTPGLEMSKSQQRELKNDII